MGGAAITSEDQRCNRKGNLEELDLWIESNQIRFNNKKKNIYTRQQLLHSS